MVGALTHSGKEPAPHRITWCGANPHFAAQMSERHKSRAPLRRTHGQAAARPARLRYRVTRAKEVRPGHSFKFLLPVRGEEEECFLINFRGHFHAFVNRCRHVPMPLDWVDNQFFAEEGRYLMCQTHNAYYQPDTGECVAGPASACGKLLYRVPLEIKDGVIYARPPEEEFED